MWGSDRLEDETAPDASATAETTADNAAAPAPEESAAPVETPARKPRARRSRAAQAADAPAAEAAATEAAQPETAASETAQTEEAAPAPARRTRARQPRAAAKLAAEAAEAATPAAETAPAAEAATPAAESAPAAEAAATAEAAPAAPARRARPSRRRTAQQEPPTEEAPVAETVTAETAVEEAAAPARRLPNLLERYRSSVKETLRQEFGYGNVMQIPRLEKVVLNVGLGETKTNPRAMESVTRDLSLITGQKPVVTRAKRSISGFKLREGDPIGVAVTLRGNRMYEFMDRLVNAALPRIRDFRGVSRRAFDGRGNYSLGIREQVIFPEIDYGQIDRIRSLQVSIVTTAGTDREAMRLLDLMGMPFTREQTAPAGDGSA